MELAVSYSYFPIPSSNTYFVGSVFEQSFFCIPSSYTSLLIEALLSDRLITLNTAQQLHSIEVTKDYCTLIDYVAFFPDPTSSILENISCFFNAPKTVFSIIQMYSNVSLVALLSFITLKEQNKVKSNSYIVLEYFHQYDTRLLLKIIELLERAGFNIVILFSSIDTTARQFISYSDAVYVGLDTVKLSSIMKRELNMSPSQKLQLGYKYTKFGQSIKVTWRKKERKVRPVPFPAEPVDYLEVVFGEKAPAVREQLEFLILEKDSSPLMNFLNALQNSFPREYLEIFTKLVNYGYLELVKTVGGGYIVMPSLKLIRVFSGRHDKYHLSK